VILYDLNIPNFKKKQDMIVHFLDKKGLKMVILNFISNFFLAT